MNVLVLDPKTVCVEKSEVFQAEDGIRDSVASRGLGDVYKRQIINNPQRRLPKEQRKLFEDNGWEIVDLSLIHI